MRISYIKYILIVSPSNSSQTFPLPHDTPNFLASFQRCLLSPSFASAPQSWVFVKNALISVRFLTGLILFSFGWPQPLSLWVQWHHRVQKILICGSSLQISVLPNSLTRAPYVDEIWHRCLIWFWCEVFPSTDAFEHLVPVFDETFEQLSMLDL